MAQLQLPQMDAQSLRDRFRDMDLSRLAELGDEFRRLGVAEELRRLDVAGGLRHLDLDAVRRLDLAQGIRDLDIEALKHLDVAGGLRHLGEAIERPDVDLAPLRDLPAVQRIQRLLGREPRRRGLRYAVAHPSPSATILAGAVIVAAGAALGGLVAWLYQPGKGDRRRAIIRRRLRRIAGKARGGSGPN